MRERWRPRGGLRVTSDEQARRKREKMRASHDAAMRALNEILVETDDEYWETWLKAVIRRVRTMRERWES